MHRSFRERVLIFEVPIYSIRKDTVRPFQAICRSCPWFLSIFCHPNRRWGTKSLHRNGLCRAVRQLRLQWVCSCRSPIRMAFHRHPVDVALQDYTKWVVVQNCAALCRHRVSRRWKARMNPPLPAVEVDNSTPSPHIPPGPKKDYSLKDDQTLTISIPGCGSKSDSGGLNLLGSRGPIDQNTNSAMGGPIPLLPPPPSAPKRRWVSGMPGYKWACFGLLIRWGSFATDKITWLWHFVTPLVSSVALYATFQIDMFILPVLQLGIIKL